MESCKYNNQALKQWVVANITIKPKILAGIAQYKKIIDVTKFRSSFKSQW